MSVTSQVFSSSPARYSDDTQSEADSEPPPPPPPWACPHCQQEYVVEEYVSPVPKHLLETNDPPLASEDRELREKFSGIQAEFHQSLAEIDDDIQKLEHTLQSMKKRRERMEDGFIAANGVLSPIRRVPREIIGNIVLYALGYEDGTTPQIGLHTESGVWAYSQVCRLWRLEILSRSFIWTSIKISQSAITKRSSSSVLFTLSTILSRSDHMPLHIDVDFSEDTASTRAVMEKLVENSNRWQTAKFCIPPKLFTSLKSLKNRVPDLERFTLEHTSNRSVGTRVIVSCLSDAPKLQQVSFSSFDNMNAVTLPWSQLTHFECESLSESDIQILERMTNLEELRFFAFGGTWDIPVIRLDKLHTLVTRSSLLPPRLCLPSLTDLTIREAHIGVATALVQRSRCTLLSLTLQGTILPSSTTGIGEFLAECQSLASIKFSVASSTPLDSVIAVLPPTVQDMWVGIDSARKEELSRLAASRGMQEVEDDPVNGSEISATQFDWETSATVLRYLVNPLRD